MIRILSIKIFKQNVHTNRIYDYSLNLTGLASQHKGFIDSELLFSDTVHQFLQVLTMTLNVLVVI